MRRLILMRHATAARGGGRDFERPLSDEGRVEARRVGERLRAIGPAPDRVISSSARRCLETWAAVAAGLGPGAPLDDAVEPDDRLYNAAPSELLEAIRALPKESEGTLLVLAHNPGVSLLALELGRSVAQDEVRLRDGFAPGAIAVFAVEGPWHDLGPTSTRLLRFERAGEPPTN